MTWILLNDFQSRTQAQVLNFGHMHYHSRKARSTFHHSQTTQNQAGSTPCSRNLAGHQDYTEPKNKPFITITGFRKAMPAHPTPHELPSAKTVARIQTFLDGFEFMRGVSNMRHQASGAVPVMPAMDVGEAMLAHLHSTMQAAPAACRMERR